MATSNSKQRRRRDFHTWTLSHHRRRIWWKGAIANNNGIGGIVTREEGEIIDHLAIAEIAVAASAWRVQRRRRKQQ